MPPSAAAAAAAAAGTTTDMSTKVGGRIVTPALPVVDSSGPTPAEQSFDELFTDFSSKHIPLEPTEGIQRRERVLDRMGTLAREWVKSVCARQGLGPDAVAAAGGQLFTSGSYRLGVHEPGADIDTILVAPNMCTREDFFGTNPEHMTDDGGRDPLSLAERIRAHPDVTNFVPVEGAAVPILTFDWEGVNIDLLFARLNSATAPASLDIDNDKVLDGVDSATEKSLNGPRVTNLIAALAAAGSPDRYQVFLKVVRIVRKWAKARGLYSNKMGYWGGVNINIAVCLTLQLYPNACAASLLRRFFLVFKSWRWPNPVMLTKPHDAGLGLTVWSQYHAANQRQVAPIITPAYPAMNSTLAVSRQTLQIMHEEFCRGYEIIDRLWKDHQKGENKSKSDGADGDANEKDPCEIFAELLEPSNFFIAYPNYLSLCIAGPTLEDSQAWAGFVESRLRKLVSDQLAKSLPIVKIQLWPKKFEACVADRTALLTKAQRQNSITYFVGFLVDRMRMRGTELNVEQQIQNFQKWELSRFQPMVPGMDLYVRSFTVKELPRICFEGMYEGGKLEAMKKRRRIRDADPRRQEAKRMKRLAKLKAKMAAMQKKKEEAAAAAKAEAAEKTGAKRKRKREDDNEEAEEEARLLDEVEQIEAEEGTTSKVDGAEGEEEEEEELLESALDQIQEDDAAGAGKTREEAEKDRQKLLAGELLVEGGEDDDDEEADDYAFLADVRNANVLPSEGRSQAAKEAALRDKEAEILKRAGYTVISDDEVPTVGGNMVLPWREPEAVSGVKKEEDGGSTVSKRATVEIKFKTPFDVVELDADGYVVDKGDDDFTPSKKWIGRRGGFEFKLGERGLGYYRTGKTVKVPSNTAY